MPGVRAGVLHTARLRINLSQTRRGPFFGAGERGLG